ncbi:hypothetical protein QE152_g18985 [Popillia japonica]|uniref:Uncharacterized protein n=1 Tax=Popillia japonica TaxID=7064 RepID=A0AAW1L4Y1_POPJA
MYVEKENLSNENPIGYKHHLLLPPMYVEKENLRGDELIPAGEPFSASEVEWLPPSGNESEDEDESPDEVIKNGMHLNDIKSNGQMSTVGEVAENIEVYSGKKRRSDPSYWRRSKKKVERHLARRQLHIPTWRCKCKDKISEEI